MKIISKKCWGAVVIALSAYILKNLFVGADTDEGYGIVLGYRLAMGDRLLLEMWEPHQTSAIFTSLFIAPFLWLTGGVKFLVIYLRAVYFVIHGAITYFVYRTFQTCIFHGEKQNALWLALVFFAVSPKCIYIPEYSNLHIWFFTLLCLSILWYDGAESPLKGRRWLLGAAGAALACDVLVYPSMVILFPVFLIYIWNRAIKKTDCLMFAAPCFLGGVLFAGYLLSYMTIDEIMQVLPKILSDGAHNDGFYQKFSDWLSNFCEIALILLFTGIAAAVLTAVCCRFRREKGDKAAYFFVFFFLTQTAYQFYCWFTSDFKASFPLVIYGFILLSGIFCYQSDRALSLSDKAPTLSDKAPTLSDKAPMLSGKTTSYRDRDKSLKDKHMPHEEKRENKACLYLILISLVEFFGVMLLSNWGPRDMMPYLILGVLGGLEYMSSYLSRRVAAWKGKVLPVLCGILVFSNVFGYCWLYISEDWNHNSILTVGGINREGLYRGIFTSYMSAYRYNTNEADWKEAVPAGSTCMYIGPNQYYYMFSDCRIAAASTISTPVYDENLLAYWNFNPDRYPDVVVVESWFGDMRAADEETFIGQWLENEFQASQVTDYSYVRVYYR